MKSPPELWAEVSDPAALARHLGEIASEIRITRTELERSVAWEGDRASGRVELAPSGWGTKVMLTVQAADAALPPVEHEPAAPAGDPAPDAPMAPIEDDAAAAPAQAQVAGSEPPAAAAVGRDDARTSEPADDEDQHQSAPVRRGPLARLFGSLSRRSRRPADPPKTRAAEGSAPEPAEPHANPALVEADAEPEPEIPPQPPPVTTAAPAAEPPAAAAPAGDKPIDQQVASAALAAMLDSLGSAHHRPFSRS